jgi:tetraacyldisaccharide 4'-kinase
MSKIRLALYPFGIIYDGITRIKNSVFNRGILKSATFNVPIIVLGNLSVGGTGKTPHTEYIANFFKSNKKTAVLSRGYGRSTSGYILATNQSTAKEIGDEPLQIYQNIPEINVAVCEDRATGINRLISEQSSELVILDDAFQHRKVQGSFYMLITTFQRPYYSDLVLPTGNLRESKSNSKRAHIIMVSKCPENLSLEEKNHTISKINPLPHQKVFFSYIRYSEPKQFHGTMNWTSTSHVLLVTGIVNPTPLKNHLQSLGKTVHSLPYKDHYDYTKNDIKTITDFISQKQNNFVVVTTSKDRVKLQELTRHINSSYSFFEIPITIGVLFNEEQELQNIVETHVNTI